MTDLPEHVRRNRALWDDWALKFVAQGERAWTEDPPTWGIFSVPEAQVGMLPDDLAGLDAIELGCGTAYVSAWLARRGARVVGIDNSAAQLATARLLRPGGRLHFLVNSFLIMLCMPAEDGVAATDRLLRRSGFQIEDLLEVRPEAGATTSYPFVTPEWARQWPCEEVWKARKRT